MDGAKSASLKKRFHSKFKKKGNNKKSRRHSFGREQNSGTPNTVDTVYRILCPGRKIGSVIGHGGSIINALRDETRAKIRVADSVPGADERVIIIFSSPTGNPSRYSPSEEPEDVLTEKENELMQPHCPAQDALLKVHERIAAEDELYGDTAFEDDNENNVVTARLLVPNNQVGCLLGKGGNIIQKLRTDTGANIRILPAEHLPACAMSTDELVQISGRSAVAKRALYEVSTQLHQNPRKENPPPNYPIFSGAQGFYPPGSAMANPLPQGNSMWSHRHSGAHGTPPMPWIGGYGNHSSGFMPGGFNGVPAGNAGEASDEFFMKILCSAEKIGGVIGKGGSNVRQLQQETGANIQVDDTIPEADERAIVVSSFEALWNPRSPTIDAILQLQSKTGEVSVNGFTTRLLVPSSKVGCLLGQGGHVITEMRRRTQADIRVYSKDNKPKCASADEELVQISGNFNVARDALSEIASRLRVRSLRGANGALEPTPLGPFQGPGPSGSIPGRGLPPPGMMGAGGSGGYEHLKARVHDHGTHTLVYKSCYNWDYGRGVVSKLPNVVDFISFHEGGGREFETQNYPVQPTATGYPNVNNSMEVKIPNSAVGSVFGTGGSSISNIREISGAKVKLQDPQAGGSECVVEIHGPSEQRNAAQNLLQAFIASSVQNFNAQQGSYQY